MSNSKAIGVAYSDPSFETLDVTGATTLGGAVTMNGNAVIVNASTDLIAFHGATAVDQAAAILTALTTGVVLTTGAGFASTAQLQALVDSVNAIIVALREKGLIAT